MVNYKNIDVFCKCGFKLLKYRKGPGNRLLKIHRDRIVKDYSGVFEEDYSEENTDILCPGCRERFARVKLIRGKYVNKVNQGQLGLVKKC